jgi:hypothetical protein
MSQLMFHCGLTPDFMFHCGLTLDYVPILIILFIYVYIGGGKNNGNTKKLRNIIFVLATLKVLLFIYTL